MNFRRIKLLSMPLPPEVWYLILCYIFSLRDCCDCRRVCRAWHEMINNVIRARIRHYLAKGEDNIRQAQVMAFFVGDPLTELEGASNLKLLLPPIRWISVSTPLQYCAAIFENNITHDPVWLLERERYAEILDGKSLSEEEFYYISRKYLALCCVLGRVYTQKAESYLSVCLAKRKEVDDSELIGWQANLSGEETHCETACDELDQQEEILLGLINERL